jgi:hypothetical protein
LSGGFDAIKSAAEYALVVKGATTPQNKRAGSTILDSTISGISA